MGATSKIVSNSAEDAAPSRSIRDIVSELRRFQSDPEREIEVPAAVSRDVTDLKHGLRDVIIEVLAAPKTATAAPDALAGQVIERLKREDVPVGDTGGYGVISNIEFRRPPEFSSWLVATTTLSIPYGEDTSLYVFELSNDSWKHVLTQESNGYKDISEAQGWLTYQVVPTASGTTPYLVTAEVSPAQASVWQALRLKILRVGADPDHPVLFAKRALSYCLDDNYYFSVRADGFGLIYLGEALDPELAGFRGVHYLEYAVSADRAWVAKEIAIDPYNVVRKWAAQPWMLAQKAVDSSSQEDLPAWHQRMRKGSWECGLSGVSLSHRLSEGKEQLLSVANCTEGEQETQSAFAVLTAGHDGFRIQSISDTKPNLPEAEGESFYYAGVEGLTNPILVSTVQAKWPAGVPMPAKQVKLRMLAIVGAHGDVTGVSVLDWPDAKIAVPAIEALKKWKYTPGRMDGKTVNVQIEVEVQFERWF